MRKLFFQDKMKVIGEISGSKVSSVSIKDGKILINFSLDIKYVNGESILIFDSCSLVCHVGVIIKIIVLNFSMYFVH